MICSTTLRIITTLVTTTAQHFGPSRTLHSPGQQQPDCAVPRSRSWAERLSLGPSLRPSHLRHPAAEFRTNEPLWASPKPTGSRTYGRLRGVCRTPPPASPTKIVAHEPKGWRPTGAGFHRGRKRRVDLARGGVSGPRRTALPLRFGFFFTIATENAVPPADSISPAELCDEVTVLAALPRVRFHHR